MGPALGVLALVQELKTLFQGICYCEMPDRGSIVVVGSCGGNQREKSLPCARFAAAHGLVLKAATASCIV